MANATTSPKGSRAMPMPNAIAEKRAAGRPPASPGFKSEMRAVVDDSPKGPGVDGTLASQWAQVRGRLRSEFGEATFRSWLKPLTLIGQHDSAIDIAVKTRFMRDWISQHYADRIRPLWQAANPAVRGVGFIVAGSQRAAGSPIHLREFRRRQIERAGSCRSPARGRGPRGAVQSSVPLWRCRPGQDPSDACGRLAYKAAHTGAARYLPLRRKVHVSVHPRTPAEERHDLQGAVPLRRRADDRRRAVHHRQGIDPRGILPHLQRAGGPEPPGGDLRRQIAPRPGGDRGAHAFAPRLGSRGRYPSDDLRTSSRHPAIEGRADEGRRTAQGAGIPGP